VAGPSVPFVASPIAPQFPSFVNDRGQRVPARFVYESASSRAQAWAMHYPGFCHTEMWLRLALVKGRRRQSSQRWHRVIPASRAIRSSSEGQR
jgi:hypothetical protein